MQTDFPISGLPLGAQLKSMLDPREAEALTRLLKVAPPPVDYRGFQRVIYGACSSIEAVCGCLKQPNQQFKDLSRDITSLNRKIEKLLSSGELCPAEHGLARTFAAYPQWRLLFKASETAGKGALALIGLELSKSFAQGKSMPAAWCKLVHRDSQISEMGIDGLISQIRDANQSSVSPWMPRAKKTYFAFLSLFEGSGFEPQPPRTFSERAQSQWTARAAYAPYPVRAGVPDLRSLSTSEFEVVLNHTKHSIDLLTAVFAVAFTGFTTEVAADIPIFQGGDPPACFFDLAAGDLVRDFTCIAYDAAQPIGVDGIPASYLVRQPLPENIARFLQEKAAKLEGAITLGDLVPLLKQVSGDDLIFPSTSKIAPSWSKLRHTLGRWLRERGTDNLIAAIQSSDFAHTGKSKLYYATIPYAEWITSLQRTYQLLSLSPPLRPPVDSLAFGSRVTPATAQIQNADNLLRRAVEELRPGRHSNDLSLNRFHLAYVKVVGFRLMALLALRETAAIPLMNAQAPFAYPAEKGSADRRGHYAAVVPTLLEEQIHLLQLHCWAFYKRLDSKARGTDFGQWLSLAGHGQANSLSYCSLKWRAAPLSTSMVLLDTKAAVHLAVDFGRKFFENQLRRSGAFTHDIDHCLRHEVKGQEFSSAVAEEIPAAWRRRAKPLMDAAAGDLFEVPIPGLRRS